MPRWTDIDDDPTRPLATPWDEYSAKATAAWTRLLDEDPVESKLQQFLERNPCFLPGGDDKLKIGGHHGGPFDAVYSQPPLRGLRRERVPDFMWINATSAEWKPVCIEIERAGKKWFTSAGVPTADFTQARSQLTEWQAWFDQPANQTIFREQYLGNRFHHRVLRPIYVLAYGRHSEFERPNERHKNPESLLAVRANLHRHDEAFMSLDSLRPSRGMSNAVTLKVSATGPELFAVPSIFRTGPGMADLAARFRDPTEAMARTLNWPEGRREYVAKRWQHWQEVADESDDMEFFPLGPFYE